MRDELKERVLRVNGMVPISTPDIGTLRAIIELIDESMRKHVAELDAIKGKECDHSSTTMCPHREAWEGCYALACAAVMMFDAWIEIADHVAFDERPKMQ